MLNKFVLTGALVLGILGLSLTPASAAVIPQSASASATIDCVSIPGQDTKVVEWKVEMHNPSPAPVDFEITVTGYPQPAQHHLDPGDDKSQIFGVFDGVQSEVIVTANGTGIVHETETPLCNPPTASITFYCGYNTPDTPGLWYEMENWTAAQHTFVVHQASGTDYTYPNGGMIGYIEEFAEDAPYNVSIDMDGIQVASLSGVGDCKPPAPETTTTTSTTTPPAVNDPSPPADVPADALLLTSGPADAEPTVSDSAPAELPRTGAPSEALTILGIALVAVGAIALTALRRRTR